MDTTKRIGMLGAGTWGIALAKLLAGYGNQVTVWSALPDEVATLSATYEHPKLPGVILPETLVFTSYIAQAIEGADIVVFATPSPYIRQTAASAHEHLREGQVLVTVAKGIELETLYTMSEVIADELGTTEKEGRIVALTGPTHAEEVGRGLPTAIVSASPDAAAAEMVQDTFIGPDFRVYTNDDIHGVELCGALKNAIALACGISTGMGFGDNAKAALITRGLEEIKRIGLAIGCSERTFDGLAGVGDLVVTATSRHSRNNRAGMLMGQGVPAEQAVAEVGMVVEGVNVLPAALAMARKVNVQAPIIEAVDSIVNGGVAPADAAAALMERDRKPEVPAF